MTQKELLALRQRWLQAAKIYYLSPGDDSGMFDHEWDHIGRTLYAQREQLPLWHDQEARGVFECSRCGRVSLGPAR